MSWSATELHIVICCHLAEDANLAKVYLAAGQCGEQDAPHDAPTSIVLDPYLSLKVPANYSGLSVRTIRNFLTHPLAPLPYHKIIGKILIRRSEFDGWITQYRRGAQPQDLDALVNEVLSGL
jgi:hypothetical protein